MPSITFDAFRGAPLLTEARHHEDNGRGTVYALSLKVGSAFDAPELTLNGLTADDLVRLVDACTACLQDGAEETVSLDDIMGDKSALEEGRDRFRANMTAARKELAADADYPFGRAAGE